MTAATGTRPKRPAKPKGGTAGLREMFAYLSEVRTRPSFACDTIGCAAAYHLNWGEALRDGWRHDVSGLRRCPACSAGPALPFPPGAGGDIPRELYEAHAAGDPAPLRDWMDEEFGPLEGPEPGPAAGMWACPDCGGVFDGRVPHEPCDPAALDAAQDPSGPEAAPPAADSGDPPCAAGPGPEGRQPAGDAPESVTRASTGVLPADLGGPLKEMFPGVSGGEEQPGTAPDETGGES